MPTMGARSVITPVVGSSLALMAGLTERSSPMRGAGLQSGPPPAPLDEDPVVVPPPCPEELVLLPVEDAAPLEDVAPPCPEELALVPVEDVAPVVPELLALLPLEDVAPPCPEELAPPPCPEEVALLCADGPTPPWPAPAVLVDVEGAAPPGPGAPVAVAPPEGAFW